MVGFAPLVLFAPFLIGARSLYWGTPLLQFYPWRSLGLELLRGGHLPLWNPYLGHGAPLLANYQSALLYPPNWLGLVLPLDLASGWLAALHLAWAGLGLALLARRVGARPLGQAVAGLAFGLSQYLVSRVGFFSINATVAWLPWLIWAVDVQLQAAGWRAALAAAWRLTAVSGLLLLAGHAQTAWYALLLAGLWAAWRLLTTAGLTWPRRASSALRLAAALGWGAGLAALQLLPTAELLRESPRATAAAYDFVMTYSYSPLRALTMLAPNLFGSPATGNYQGYGNYWEDANYVGVLPLALALTLLVPTVVRAGWRALRRVASAAPPEPGRGLPLFLGGVSVIAVVWGLGVNTPVFPWLYAHVPTFSLFQAPTRVLIWLTFALALLAGLGTDRWRAPSGRAHYWTRLGAMGAATLLLGGLAGGVLFRSGTELAATLRTVALSLGWAGALLLATAALSLLQPTLTPGRWGALVVSVVLVDLLAAGWGLNPGADPAAYRAPAALDPALDAALGGHRLWYPPDDEQAAKFETLLSFQTFGPPQLALTTRAVQLPNVGVLDRRASANNFDPLVSARYAAFTELAAAHPTAGLLALMDVAVVAVLEDQPDWELLSRDPQTGIAFYRAPGEPRRVWVVGAARVVPNMAAALAALADPAFDPAAEVVLEAGAAQLPPSRISLTPSINAVTIQVSLAAAGWVVVSDTFYPGWVAAVDGQPAPLWAANAAFRAVPVPAGSHVVRLDYQPCSVALGGLITLVALVGWAGLGLLAHVAGRRSA
ncbi:MAG: hypothetical protein IT317_07180 [Anaerolineales bacterium]|nr:hypothetical protein [Anaerolineales bacterium]